MIVNDIMQVAGRIEGVRIKVDSVSSRLEELERKIDAPAEWKELHEQLRVMDKTVRNLRRQYQVMLNCHLVVGSLAMEVVHDDPCRVAKVAVWAIGQSHKWWEENYVKERTIAEWYVFLSSVYDEVTSFNVAAEDG